MTNPTRSWGLLGFGSMAITASLVACVAEPGDGEVGTASSEAITSSLTLTCNRLDVERGRTGLTDGESLAALRVRDQTGTADRWTKYVNFDANTSAVCVFALPSGVTATQIATASVTVNYRGPRKADMLWTFEVKDTSSGTFALVGDNGFAKDWAWTSTTFPLASPRRLFSSAGGELALRYATASSFDNSMLDYLVVNVTLDPAAPADTTADAGADAAAPDASATDASSPTDAGAALDSAAPDATAPSGYLYGVTVDSIDRLSDTTTALAALPKRPTTRIVFDEGQPPSYYAQAVPAIHAVSNVMGEILDSYYVKTLTTAQYAQRTTDYLNAFPTGVDIWEVGNEINGNWLGARADVVAKMTAAFDLVKARGGKTELTLYGCSDSGATYDMFNWVKTNVPARMLTGLDYVLVSYYEGDCGSPRSDWASVFQQLRQLFPSAGLGFGEVGAVNANGNPITDASIAGPYLQKYYGMPITTPGYVGGGFWWYFVEDMTPMSKPLFPVLASAISAMP